jgi:hypothetical protein
MAERLVAYRENCARAAAAASQTDAHQDRREASPKKAQLPDPLWSTGNSFLERKSKLSWGSSKHQDRRESRGRGRDAHQSRGLSSNRPGGGTEGDESGSGCLQAVHDRHKTWNEWMFFVEQHQRHPQEQSVTHKQVLNADLKCRVRIPLCLLPAASRSVPAVGALPHTHRHTLKLSEAPPHPNSNS